MGLPRLQVGLSWDCPPPLSYFWADLKPPHCNFGLAIPPSPISGFSTPLDPLLGHNLPPLPKSPFRIQEPPRGLILGHDPLPSPPPPPFGAQSFPDPLFGGLIPSRHLHPPLGAPPLLSPPPFWGLPLLPPPFWGRPPPFTTSPTFWAPPCFDWGLPLSFRPPSFGSPPPPPPLFGVQSLVDPILGV